jgi:hypothetical protein
MDNYVQEWLKRSLNFANFVASQESRPECCGLVLSALLIIPIQRVPRSVLLDSLYEFLGLKPLITHADINCSCRRSLNIQSEHIQTLKDSVVRLLYFRGKQNSTEMIPVL